MASKREQVATLKAKIEKLQADLVVLEAEADKEIDTSAVKPGDTVTFDYGKGETRKSLTGLVVGVKLPAEGEKGGALAKIAVGEGFESMLVQTYLSSITHVAAA